ncbi:MULTISPECIES: DUF3156 family protein [unclassified Pseudomonas]|uniref:DUF3156 family protein n=1 Tax=unclassified Pseudomonas TaxID=196821 RepID=UPI00209821D1|nr:MULTISPECIES: DUF3156 family protein [unclassified Pseudomonas]MCO7518196.1 DUF3156 family protein [Pseudomonas sp. 1]MCO7541495.1 DUF3156 family protein [Pseudomonas sp. VA159-2]
MSASWLERLSAPRAPAGYRPGATLQRLARNLGVADLSRFSYRKDGPRIEVRERTESHLLMHLVMCEFILRVPAQGQGTLRAELQHTGVLRRSGLACRLRGGDPALFEALKARLGEVDAMLMPLDFKRLVIDCGEGEWRVTLEHMGASEVVNRMPALRRYIPLDTEQRRLLWRAFDVLADTLQTL